MRAVMPLARLLSESAKCSEPVKRYEHLAGRIPKQGFPCVPEAFTLAPKVEKNSLTN